MSLTIHNIWWGKAGGVGGCAALGCILTEPECIGSNQFLIGTQKWITIDLEVRAGGSDYAKISWEFNGITQETLAYLGFGVGRYPDVGVAPGSPFDLYEVGQYTNLRAIEVAASAFMSGVPTANVIRSSRG